MELTKWKKTNIKLTKKEQDCLDDLSACRNACEKIIKKIVREYELSEIQQTEFWRAMDKKYKLDRPNFQYRVNENGDVFHREEFAEEVERITKTFEAAPLIKKKVLEAFGLLNKV